jgi:hypothetical protein
LTVAAACSSFDEAPSDPQDGGSTGTDGGTEAAQPDASPDAITVVERPCIASLQGRLMCEDFEIEKKPNYGFKDMSSNGAPIALDWIPSGNGHALSYKHVIAGGVSGYLRFEDPVRNVIDFDALTLTFDVEILQRTSYGEIAGIWLFTTAASDAGGQVQWIGVDAKYVPVGGGSHKINLRVERTNKTFKRIIAVDGNNPEAAAKLFTTTTETGWDLRIGTYNSEPGTIDMRIDNVVLIRE